MAKTVPPKPTREKKQRSLDVAHFARVLPQWMQPQQMKAAMWRSVVARQPIAVTCRESLIASLSSLDWKIEARDSTQRDELKSEIDYYTRFFEYTGDHDFHGIVEWIGKDFLDLPFGAAAELGYENDDPKEKLLWIELLDGGTLFPTDSRGWPVGQRVDGSNKKPIYFPQHAINRVYMSPRTEIDRKGWGMAPPEKIYLALELLGRGDVYYANLLLDTPEAGILDLMDMEKESAERWIEDFRSLMGGIDPFKIPVLYEHTSEAKYIPFGRPPTELMFDSITGKYASIVAAGYGMSLSDVGIQGASSGGDTLAGSIRQERRTRRTGFARLKKKIKFFFDRMLPEYLKFSWIDLDDEFSVALGRARLASATAFGQLIDKQVVLPSEARLQLVSDGLLDISIPETLDGQDEFPEKTPTDRNPKVLGKPVPPSQGGHGEILQSKFVAAVEEVFVVEDIELRRIVKAVAEPVAIEVRNTFAEDFGDAFEDLQEISIWGDWHDMVLWGEDVDTIPELTLLGIANARTAALKTFSKSSWWKRRASDLSDEHVVNMYAVMAVDEQNDIIRRAYESGESDVIGLSDTISDRERVAFAKKVTRSVAELWNSVGDRIINAAITGTRRTMCDGGNFAVLDTAAFLNDNMDKVVYNIRGELENVRRGLISDYVDVIEKLISTELEVFDGRKN